MNVGEGTKLNMDSLTHKSYKERSITNAVFGNNLHKGSQSYSVKAVDIKKRLNQYVPIALYLAVTYGYLELAVKITFYDSNFADRKLQLNTQSLLSSLDFLELLLTSVI